MKLLTVVEPAELELHEAIAWYRDRDARVADRFASEVRQTLQLIERFEQIYTKALAITHVNGSPTPIYKAILEA